MSGSPAVHARRLRILHLVKGFDVGGAERIISLLVQVGDRSRFDYTVAHALAGHGGLAGEVEAGGIPVHDLGAVGQWDLRWVVRLRQLLRRRRFDVVHLHLPYTAGLGRLAAWSLGPGRPRVVHTQHNMWSRTEPATRTLSRVTWWMDDADLAVAESVRADLPARLARRTEVLLHGIDLRVTPGEEARVAMRAELGAADGEVLVVTVANLRREKAYEVLLESARILVSEGLPARFVAVGHGPLEGEVRGLCTSLGLDDRFAFLGLRTDVGKILAAADVFVLASHHEGFPLSVMEALGGGVPVVVTGVGELPRVVRDGLDGLLVPPGDPAALAGALRGLVVDRERLAFLTSEARKGAARFDIRGASRRIEGLYWELAGPGETRMD